MKVLALVVTGCAAFTAPRPQVAQRAVAVDATTLDRRAVLAAVPVAAAATLFAATDAASAKGRGTQGAMSQRYYPRIIALGKYLSEELPSLIAAGDFVALEAATAADIKSKKGVVGPLYSGESAMSLWANSYSETAVSDKTKAMLAEVDALEAFRAALTDVAGKGTGKGLKKVGGFLGIGATTEAAPPPEDLKRRASAGLADAKKAYNKYVALNNAGIPLEINSLKAI